MISCHSPVVTHVAESERQAQFYCKEGREALRGKDLVQAEIAFKQALMQKADYPAALLGLARIDILQGRLHLAEEKLKTCIALDSLQFPAWLLLGKIHLQREEFNNAVRVLTKAQKMQFPPQYEPLRPHLCLLRAKALYGIADYESAEICFKEALSRFPNDSTLYSLSKTNMELKRIVSGKPKILRQIALKKQVTRADLAILFEQLLPVKNSCSKKVPNITDWPQDSLQARAFRRAVQCSWLPVLPDSTVRPADTVQRVELAIFASHIMLLSGAGKFQTTQEIKDVEHYKPFYEDVLRTSVYGIIKTDNEGHFLPERLLSGEEALLAVNRLSCILERAGLPFYFKRPNGEHCEGY